MHIYVGVHFEQMVSNFSLVYGDLYPFSNSKNVMSVETISSYFDTWLVNNECLFMERRNGLNRKQNLQLPEYFNKLRRWCTLIADIRANLVDNKIQDQRLFVSFTL